MIPKETRRRIDRAQGALLGLLLGDAIGSLVDGWSRSAIRSRLGGIKGPATRDDREYLLGRVRRGEKPRKVMKSVGTSSPPGLYFHQGQQALMSAECALGETDVDGEGFARTCARFTSPSRRGKFGLHRKPSRVFRVSIGRFMDGEDWREGGEESSRTDCIPAALPVGLAHGRESEDLSRRAAEIALVTDRTPFGIMSAVSLANLADILSDLDSLVPARDVLEILMARLAAQGSSVREHLGKLDIPSPEEFDSFGRILSSLATLWIGPEGEEGDGLALRSLAQTVQSVASRPEKKLNARFAPAGLAASAYFALTETEGPHRAILRAVNTGGMTACLGALTGGLAGARWGRDAFPREWIEGLWNSAFVIRMAESLARPRGDRPWTGDLHATELKTNESYRAFKDDLKKELLEFNEQDDSRPE